MIILYLVLGYLASRFHWAKKHHVTMLNQSIVNVIMPAVIILNLYRHPFQTSDMILGLSVWLQVGLAALIFLAFGSLVQRRLQFSKGTCLALFFSVGFPNTSFIGFPLLNFFVGPDAIAPAISIDQFGTFLCFSLVAVPIAAMFGASQDPSTRRPTRLRKVLTNPMTLAVFLSLALSALKWNQNWPALILQPLSLLNALLAPATLFSFGTLLKFDYSDIRHYRRELMVGLGLRHVAFPLAVASVFSAVATHAGINPFQQKVLVLESMMPPMLMASLLSIEKGFAPRLTVLMLELGVFITVIQLAIMT